MLFIGNELVALNGDWIFAVMGEEWSRTGTICINKELYQNWKLC